MATWPPTLDELKSEMKIDVLDVRDDERLTRDLDAAISFIERVRPVFQYDLTDPDQLELPEVTDEHKLGTLRLAARWKTRDRSPDGLISMGDLGSSRVTSFDPDIDRQLRIGKFAPSVIA